MQYKYDLSIIIVSWNVRELLQKCISSIFEQTNTLHFEIIVVDNDSRDGTYEYIKSLYPNIRVIANKKNVGFAKANNQGLRVAQGEYILLLNPDTLIIDRAIEKTYNWMKENKQAAIVGCRMKNPDGTGQLSVRAFPSIKAISLIMLKLHRVFPRAKALKEYLQIDFDYNKSQPVSQVMGAFFMIRPDTITKLGYLDEKYFIWFEEVDYCLRAKNANLETWYYSGAEVIHYYGQSFRQVLSLRKQVRLNNSLLRYFKKNSTSGNYFLIVMLYPLSLIPSLIISLFIQPFKR